MNNSELVENIINYLCDYKEIYYLIDDEETSITTSYFAYYFRNQSLNHLNHQYMLIDDGERKYINQYLEKLLNIKINWVTHGQYKFDADGILIRYPHVN